MVKLLVVDLVRSRRSGASDGHFRLLVQDTGDVGGWYCLESVGVIVMRG